MEVQHQDPDNDGLKGAYVPGYGYTDDAVNLYLFHNTDAPRIRFVTTTVLDSSISRGTCSTGILKRLPHDCQRFIIKFTKTYSGERRSHTACVKFSSSAKKWYLVDSKRPSPLLIDSPGAWEDLHGQIYLPYMAHGDCTGSFIETWEGQHYWLDALFWTTVTIKGRPLDTMSFRRQDAHELNEARKTLGLAQEGANRSWNRPVRRRRLLEGKGQQVAHRTAKNEK